MSRKFPKKNFSNYVKRKLIYEFTKMDKYEFFPMNVYITPVEEFFKTEVTDEEMVALTYMYNRYTVTKIH